VIQLPTDTRGIYGDIVGEYVQDVNLTPQFPLAARTASAMWEQRFGTSVDGVIAMDPVALSYLLKATGPVSLPGGGQLSTDNAVPLLLSEVYARFAEPAQQDAFFASAAASVFSRIAGGHYDPASMISGLSKAGDERRILVWSRDDAEEKVIAQTSLAGNLPSSSSGQKTFGVYLNDATGSKMDYYLKTKLAIGQVSCRKDGRPNYVVRLTMTNGAAADAGAVLPAYVTGGGVYGVAPGNISTIVDAYAPKGMSFLGATRDGKPVSVLPATNAGYPLAQYQVVVAPGQSTVVEFQFLGSRPFSGMLSAQTTPTIYGVETSGLVTSCKSALQ
jgi:hypothetical protein